MDKVSYIVRLPHLDDSDVQEGVLRSKRKRTDTISQLYEFDATQTYALAPIEQDLQTMNAWLTDMEGLFQAGVSAINFVPSQWNVQTFRSGLRTELFPKVYLNPNDLWIKEQEQLIGTMITAGTFRNLEGNKVQTIGEKGSSRPDLYQTGHSIEVKNYKITTSSGRSRLVSNVSKQVEKRLSDLPNGTKQSVIIDIRGQNISDEILEELYEKIMNKTNGKVDIRFKTN